MKRKNEAPVADFTEPNAVFTPEMKNTHTVLVPDMLPWHFDLLTHILRGEGYRVEVLHNEGRAVIDEGLKHVHNDACYPALCVIGQFLDALKSGKYDPDRTAVLITQTGGGCRASNYLPLIRKALRAEFPQVRKAQRAPAQGVRRGEVFPLQRVCQMHLRRICCHPCPR